MTFGQKVLEFNRNLTFSGSLPEGIQVMNPFRNNPDVDYISNRFYTRFYSDNDPRTMILGINPGRLGAGATGIPFTDTKRLNEECGILFTGFKTHEPSSSFIYSMIDAMGGVTAFYRKFFVSAICPLGFTSTGKNGRPVNYNYYDSAVLMKSAYPFILHTLKQQVAFGTDGSVCFCLGIGPNEKFLRKLNDEYHFFERIIALEHPRFIMQYKSRLKQEYIDKYVKALN